MRYIAIIASVVLITVVGCGRKSTETEVLPLNDMKTILWDLENADVWFNQIPFSDSINKTRQMNIKLYEQVFATHNITKKQFYNSYQYYQAKPDKMKTLMDSVVAYGERIKVSYKEPAKPKTIEKAKLVPEKATLVPEKAKLVPDKANPIIQKLAKPALKRL